MSLHSTTHLELKHPVLGRPHYSGFHTVVFISFFKPLLVFLYRFKGGGSTLKLEIQTPTAPHILLVPCCIYSSQLLASSCSDAETCACTDPEQLFIMAEGTSQPTQNHSRCLGACGTPD